jgi:sulfide:quinone oxidoreductase
VAYAGGMLEVTPGPSIACDHALALPRLRGPAVPGLPADAAGFVRTDVRCRAVGMADVFAAGDAAAFAVKQGGLAAQQADVAAQGIAADAGVPVQPERYRPVLRAVLVSAGQPIYMRAELAGGAGDTSAVSSEPMWWPPAKIAGAYLAPHLAGLSPMPAAAI